ncbi:MAG: MCE family protein [Candidatus Abyssobacteria bacterium SURF_17]|uniref:MCE family protein n=1 Tax=Candidatus Abyssobacteria bacterium SURF_17 TaxID=2093361 RepID=A0A419EWZ0_9BACT|nr:MAG: MCE family protein [Candidatus Abyssubacteria bacterium SURF_17]
MPRRRGKLETIVGIFVLASLALLFVIVALIGRRQNIFERRYEITGVFDSVAGLQTGADVLLAGINVGHVRDVTFGSTNRVQVIMSISETQRERIRGDSIASIKTMGLMGDRYIEITVGSAEEPVIPDGGTIKTSEIFELAELLAAARPALGNMENAIKNISKLTDELADPAGEVGTILDNVKVLTTEARAGKGTLGALLTRDDLYRKASTVLDSANVTMENFKVVSSNAKGASTEFPAIMERAKSSVDKFNEFSSKAADTAEDFAEMIASGRTVMKEAETIASNLTAASEDIREATPRIGPLIDSADETIGEARKVIDASKRSWLIRGYFEPAVPGEPIAISGRDVARPEVTR